MRVYEFLAFGIFNEQDLTFEDVHFSDEVEDLWDDLDSICGLLNRGRIHEYVPVALDLILREKAFESEDMGVAFEDQLVSTCKEELRVRNGNLFQDLHERRSLVVIRMKLTLLTAVE